jgi:hypothetical protein
MFGFGKKRMPEPEAVRGFIRGLLDDVDSSYPSYFQKIESGELLGHSFKVFPMADDARYFLALASLTLELIAARNIFRDDRARRIIRMSIDEFSRSVGKDPAQVRADIDEFEDDYNTFAGRLRLDPTGIAEKVYIKMGIPLTKIEGFDEPRPAPLMKVALSSLLTSSVGRWMNISNDFKLTKAK